MGGLSRFLLSGVLGEAEHCYLSREGGAGGGSDCEARWRDGVEADDGSGKVGIV